MTTAALGDMEQTVGSKKDGGDDVEEVSRAKEDEMAPSGAGEGEPGRGGDGARSQCVGGEGTTETQRGETSERKAGTTSRKRRDRKLTTYQQHNGSEMTVTQLGNVVDGQATMVSGPDGRLGRVTIVPVPGLASFLGVGVEFVMTSRVCIIGRRKRGHMLAAAPRMDLSMVEQLRDDLGAKLRQLSECEKSGGAEVSMQGADSAGRVKCALTEGNGSTDKIHGKGDVWEHTLNATTAEHGQQGDEGVLIDAANGVRSEEGEKGSGAGAQIASDTDAVDKLNSQFAMKAARRKERKYLNSLFARRPTEPRDVAAASAMSMPKRVQLYDMVHVGGRSEKVVGSENAASSGVVLNTSNESVSEEMGCADASGRVEASVQAGGVRPVVPSQGPAQRVQHEDQPSPHAQLSPLDALLFPDISLDGFKKVSHCHAIVVHDRRDCFWMLVCGRNGVLMKGKGDTYHVVPAGCWVAIPARCRFIIGDVSLEFMAHVRVPVPVSKLCSDSACDPIRDKLDTVHEDTSSIVQMAQHAYRTHGKVSATGAKKDVVADKGKNGADQRVQPSASAGDENDSASVGNVEAGKDGTTVVGGLPAKVPIFLQPCSEYHDPQHDVDSDANMAEEVRLRSSHYMHECREWSYEMIRRSLRARVSAVAILGKNKRTRSASKTASTVTVGKRTSR